MRTLLADTVINTPARITPPAPLCRWRREGALRPTDDTITQPFALCFLPFVVTPPAGRVVRAPSYTLQGEDNECSLLVWSHKISHP